MTITEPEEAQQYLEATIDKLFFPGTDLRYLAEHPLSIQDFCRFPAASSHHHTLRGGLLVHTAQVTKLLMAAVEGLFLEDNKEHNHALAQTAFLGAIWHDYGKIFEYEVRWDEDTSPPMINKTFRKPDCVGHIILSRDCFMGKARSLFPDADERQMFKDVERMILSHHGRLSWGSPLEPKYPLEHLLHGCDMASAKTMG